MAVPHYYKYTPLCHKAYMHYMDMQFAEGNAAVKAEMKANPQNLMAVYIANYADCLLLLFNGDKEDYNKWHEHLAQRQDLFDNGDRNSPWHRLCKAGVYMQWAFVHIRMGDNLKAASNFRKSYALLKENQKRFPDFEYNDILMGLEEAVVGTVPDDYRWIAAIFGMRGNVKKGVARINRFVANHTTADPLYFDAVIYNVYLRFYLMSQQEQVWQSLSNPIFNAENNMLLSFVKANIAVNYRKADAALDVLRKMRRMPAYKYIPAFEYEMGSALMYKADTAAMSHMQYFISHYKGKMFVKDALHKMAYISYLSGSMQQAKHYRALIPVYGSTTVDADKRARRFGETNEWPHPDLLRAHLLIDGGYYTAAAQLLAGYKEADFGNQPDKAEYNLRAGRAAEENGQTDKALSYYARCIKIGYDAKEYFAARAALQTAFIYEKRGQYDAARKAFEQILDMPVQDYRNALKQQAKAGINRLEGNS